MVHILLKPFYGSQFENDQVFKLDNGDNIFSKLDERLKREQIDIHTYDLKSDKWADAIVYCDLPYPWQLGQWILVLKNRRKNVLYCFESPVINPFSHYRFFYRLFSKVYTWNDPLVDNKKVFKFCIPQVDSSIKILTKSFNKKKLLCLINNNKSIPLLFWIISGFKKDLYRERVTAINFFENSMRTDFDLYGKGWTGLSVYNGTIPRESGAKLKVLSKYKFAIAFENCVADGYISEKMIDCFKAQVVPVYWGAPNVSEYIPENCFINFNNFKNYKRLAQYLQKMDKKTHDTYIQNAQQFLKSQRYRNHWTQKAFVKTFFLK